MTTTRIFALHEELADAVNARRDAEQYLEDAYRTNNQLRGAMRKLREENDRLLVEVAELKKEASDA